jgi:hypothetical protein
MFTARNNFGSKFPVCRSGSVFSLSGECGAEFSGSVSRLSDERDSKNKLKIFPKDTDTVTVIKMLIFSS